MALFHLHVTQVKRSAGQSGVTSAAYRAGEKLYSEYYGEVSDYTHKGGVVCTNILLPPQPPPSIVTAPPSGTPWRRPSAARKPSLHTALTSTPNPARNNPASKFALPAIQVDKALIFLKKLKKPNLKIH